MDAPITYVCPANGHLVQRRLVQPGKVSSDDENCPEHGVRLFRLCSVCKREWPLVRNSYSSRPTAGAKFCRACSEPAPWLSRDELMAWLQHQVQASSGISAATRQELRAVLERIGNMKPGDTKSIPGWKMLRDRLPKVWASTKSARGVLMGEVVERALDKML